MAEIKNSFLSSKMNKDLDDRLVPNGEYRDALNISVGKSENSDIGTVQNVLGNYEILEAYEENLFCIGFYMDNQNNRIYRFLTDYKDPSPTVINMAPEGTTHKITVYDFNTAIYSVLVEGIFLNFSTTNLMLGINLLEGLLFFTDNRNQPRKINYSNAISNPLYYTTETQISVAKYAPVEAPILFREVNTTAVSVDGLEVTVEDATGIVNGMTLISNNIGACDYVTVLGNPIGNVVTLYSLPLVGIDPGDNLKFLISTMSDQSDNPDWPGDPAYLESKYVRFSYRFKFDDNEYSILAPFSQIAYIPKQKGYFINGDEQAAYRSTILKWMENNINNVEVLIPLPDVGNNIRNSYKITAVDILYKESNSLAIKVLDSVSYSTISGAIGANSNIYSYKYQSQKPYKTLPESQLTRVYDKVPTRALAQELSGNRVIYGNFHTTYTPPKYIDYKIGAQPKNESFENFIEYPNHTLKQNRNYQVGFILADKFGRQSSVILSTVDLATLQGLSSYGSSTIYSPYKKEYDPIFPGVKCWQGNALRILINNTIESNRNIPAGTPGLYAQQIQQGFAITYGVVTGNSFTFWLDETLPANPITVPEIGDYLRGKYTDYVKVIGRLTPHPPDTTIWTITTDGEINDLYNYNDPGEGRLDLKFAYSLNQIGWYSYKVVVKQREQDYYNVYLPGMLDGYPVNQTSGSQVVYSDVGDPSLENGINVTNFPTNETGRTSHIVLINDNINKVPRDLAEVGPDQKQYRSSVELYGRVENYPAKFPLTIEPVATTDLYASMIMYNINDDPYNLMDIVRPGDGIQCNIPNSPAGVVLPKWYGDTTITSIENFNYSLLTPIINPPGSTIDVGKYNDIEIGDEISYDIAGMPYTGTVAGYSAPTGILTLTVATTVSIPKNTRITITRPDIVVIKFTPYNPILGLDSASPDYAYTSFTITSAENWQYYPLRKADIVNTIAYATDFNFLSNTVNNVTGTAGLNFYQLQSNPLIGRISTSKKMGTLPDDMIPVLGIYETAAVESMLDLFWETSTTGLISDLNWNVLTDFNGAAGTTNPFFDFWEDQDWQGNNDDKNDDFNTGDANSPFISRKFFITDNVNNSIEPTSCTLFSVFDLDDNDVTSLFELVSVPGTITSYRIKIKSNFIFNYDANTLSNFKFSLKVIYADLTTYVPLFTRLQNRAPEFLLDKPQYVTITVSTVDILQLTATNGAFPINTNGLWWRIINGNDDNYFSINKTTGQLKLDTPLAQLGSYHLTVEISDAASFVTDPPSLLENPGYADLSSKSDIIEVYITIGDNPVNPFLEYYTNGDEGFIMPNYDPENPDAPTLGYFGVYVGTQLDTSAPGVIPTLPYGETIDLTYNGVVNVEAANGAQGFPYPSPKGLTQGSLRFRWTVFGSSYQHANLNYAALLIYYRPNSTSSWTLIKDDNYSGSTSTPWWGNNYSYPAPNCLVVRALQNNISEYRRASTGSIKVSQPGEYFFALKAECQGSFGPIIVVEDANYYYKRIDPVYPNVFYQYTEPFIPRERFITGLIDPVTTSASGISYNGFSTYQKFDWSIAATVAYLDPITPTTKFILNNVPPVPNIDQIVPGVWVTKNLESEYTSNVQVTGFNTLTNEVTIVGTFGSGPVIVGDTLTFRQLQKTNSSNVRPLGNVWASNKDFTYIKQFYNQGEFLSFWNVPNPNNFYNFKPTPLGNPVLPTSPGVPHTGLPNSNVTGWGSAQITNEGKIVTQTSQNTISTVINNIETFSLAKIAYDNYRIPFWPSVYDIGTNYISLDHLPVQSALPGAEIPLLTWSTECTTPTELYYPDETVDADAFTISNTYTITGLTPNTVYYINVYLRDPQGYMGGDYHPIAVRTLAT